MLSVCILKLQLPKVLLLLALVNTLPMLSEIKLVVDTNINTSIDHIVLDSSINNRSHPKLIILHTRAYITHHSKSALMIH